MFQENQKRAEERSASEPGATDNFPASNNDQSQPELTKAERRRLKRERKKEGRWQQQKTEQRKKVMGKIIWLLVIAGLVAGLYFWFANRKVLPPITMQGHIEVSPQSHILTEPMPLNVQKHMLEHADGSGPPGIIINYNCDDFSCEQGFVDKLAALVQEYPANVYLAPYRRMSAQLVLTRLGGREILENYDEQKIRNFIER